MREEEERKNAEEEKVERQEKHALFFFQFVSSLSAEYLTLVFFGFYNKCSKQYSIFDNPALTIQLVEQESHCIIRVHMHTRVVYTVVRVDLLVINA